jgi:hypothetical protein
VKISASDARSIPVPPLELDLKPLAISFMNPNDSPRRQPEPTRVELDESAAGLANLRPAAGLANLRPAAGLANLRPAAGLANLRPAAGLANLRPPLASPTSALAQAHCRASQQIILQLSR